MNLKNNDRSIPLLVDMDGALIATDTLFETALLFLKHSPFKIIMLLVWLFRGKQFLKENLSKYTNLNVDTLPYRQDVIDYLRSQSDQGRKIILLTGSWGDLANRVADRFDFISEVVATSQQKNMTGQAKAEYARQRWGGKLFDYLGNEKKDLHVWKYARRAIVVGPQNLAETAANVAEVEHIFVSKTAAVRTWLKAIRIHQWAKNMLIFVPLLTSHSLLKPELAVNALLAYLSFCTVASATYLLNDLLDLEADRKHHAKRNRPLASGEVTILQGIVVGALLFCLGIYLAIEFTNTSFLIILIVYLILTILYSFVLKHLQSADVITLASLFTIRIIAGAAAISVPLSFWLLCFSMFLFLSLAMIKRVAELIHLERQAGNKSKQAAGRDYLTADIVVLQSLGGASGFMSVLVFALYVNSEQVVTMYNRPEVLWLVIPVIGYWITRIWIAATRGEIDEDPVSYALHDLQSWMTVGVLLTLFFLAAVL